MRRLLRAALGTMLGAALVTGALSAPPAHAQEEYKVLVFSKTTGFRHDSIPAGIAAIKQLGADHHFGVDATEDASAFTYDNLKQYKAVIWLSTTGDVLNDAQQAEFEKYMRSGGGYVGVHSAADTEYDWAWYGRLVGAYFKSHPAIQQANVKVTDRVHPSTKDLPKNWIRTDEWYNYQADPRGKVHVLAALDEKSYQPGDGAMGHDHPISWCHDYSGGRAWYTGMGHTAETFSEPEFLEHLLGGIQTAAGVVPADCGATVTENFQQVAMAKGKGIGEPMGLAVLPDLSVLSTSRDGSVYHTSRDGVTTLAAKIPVYNHDEDGLQAIALDPDFARNGWVYLYYAPPLDTPAGDAPKESSDPAEWERWRGYNQLSRFKYVDGKLDLASEQKILQVPSDRGICCHVGGQIDFDAAGNLYLSTGDDTNPFESSGYTPIDERPNRNPAFDAQRTAANTNDLRGKILRITVNADGSYSIPEGNMFAPGTPKTRPEIYAMGFRNPFRFSVDKKTGVLYVGDYGPDAGAADPNRGPGGQVEFNRVTGPGFYGWPYCTGTNTPEETYVDYDFATGTSGQRFDCTAPKNTSPHNTGLVDLPAAKAAWIKYDGGSVPEFGTGGESPMGGPVYRYDPDLASEVKFPPYFDGVEFAYEWDRGWIKNIHLNEDGTVLKIDPLFDRANISLVRPMDLKFGPDGALYVLDYGSGYFGGADDSAIYRIEYVKGARSPVARIGATPTSGKAPLQVRFSSEGSYDPDPGDTFTYAWDFTGDGTVDSTEPNPTFTYTANGVYPARLTLTDSSGKTGTATIEITVGNTAPTVEFVTPAHGQFFEFGDVLDFEVTVTDPDGTPVDCAKVKVEYILGHDNHGHPLTSVNGCKGSIRTASDGGHGADANVFGVLNASYTDTGGEGGTPPLTGEGEIVLQPKHKQAEFFTAQQGVQVVAHSGAAGGKRVGYLDAGDWIMFDPIDLDGIDGIGYRVSSGGSGGTIELRADSPTGPLLQTTEVQNTGGWDNYVIIEPRPFVNPGGTHKLYLVFSGGFDVDEFFVTGKGAPGNSQPQVSAKAEPTSGAVPLEVRFTGTATDPDGDALTYEWDFGDGSPKDATKDATHTYTKPGEYTATFTATDASGLSAQSQVKVSAYQVAPPCADPGKPVDPNDEFDGDVIDRCRWSTVVREDPLHYRVADGRLVIDAQPGDMYGATTDAKNLLLQNAPAGSWEAVTKVDLRHSGDVYEQAGLMVYGDDKNFVKLSFIKVPDGRNLEFIQNVNGTPADNGDADRTPLLAADFPSTVWLKVTSDGTTLSAAYSTDGTDWTRFGRPRLLSQIPNPKVGLAAFNGTGMPAAFDFFHLKSVDTTCQPTEPEAGYQSLFDGTPESLARWRQAGPGGFVYANCELLSTGGLGLYWYDQEFQAYSLKLDWKVAGDDNSGVFVGFPNPGNDPWKAVNEGYEVQIDMTDVPEKTTGAIYGFQSADIAARDKALKPPGQWNTYEIVVKDQTITVFLNGTKINEFTNADPNRDLSSGFVGIQNHGNGDDVWFRNIRIKELVPPTVTVSGVSDGGAYGDSGDLTIAYDADDSGSGVASVTAELDGAAISSGAELPLYKLALGEHTLVVTATDKAGNTATKTVRFQVDTSIQDLKKLVQRFRVAGQVNPGGAVVLQRRLDRAQTYADAQDTAKTVAELEKFRRLARNGGLVPGAEARSVFARDATALIERYGGGA